MPITRKRKHELAVEDAISEVQTHAGASDINDEVAVALVAKAAKLKFEPADEGDAQVAKGILATDCVLSRLSGRVCRSRNDEGFRTLHPDGEMIKPWSWVIAEDGLRMLLSQATILASFRRLGFTDSWVRAKLENGERFRLAVFPRTQAVLATWDGIISIASEHYPASVRDKVLSCAEALRTTPFAAIEVRAKSTYLDGSTYFEINEAAVGGRSDDPRYIDTPRLASDDVIGTLEEVRGWLYHVLGCSELFDGAGWTKDADGHHVVREYLVHNRPVADFGEAFSWIDLPIRREDVES